MSDKKGKGLREKVEDTRIEDELERKFFPKTHEMKKQEKAMKDPAIFEEQLTEKLRRRMIKK